MSEFQAKKIVVNVPMDPWLDISGLVKYSSLSRSTLLRRIDSPVNPIPCRRVGGKILIRASWFDEWTRREDEHAKLSGENIPTVVDEVIGKIQEGTS